MNRKAPELTVVIPTLGRHAKLLRVLEALERQDVEPGSFQVTVVVDFAEPATDSIYAATGKRPYAARGLQADVPGPSAARNLGWREAATKLVLFLDDDVVPGRRLIGEHLEWHHRNPAETSGVLGHVRWARELRVTPFMRWLEHGIQFDYPNIVGDEAGWGRFYTANVSVKRSILERVGGFDQDRFPFGYEDLELAYRMSKLGFRLLYNRRAEGEHLHQMDLDFWRRRVRRIAYAERQFVDLYPEIPAYFHELFRKAAAAPPARGRGARLLNLLPRAVPRLGPKAWRSADLHFRQALAPHFLAAWDEAGSRARSDAASRPDLTERTAGDPENADERVSQQQPLS